jgi:hypothetical protein
VTTRSTTGDIGTCPYCGGMPHSPASCLAVKAIEYYPDGTIKRVEKAGPPMPTELSPAPLRPIEKLTAYGFRPADGVTRAGFEAW